MSVYSLLPPVTDDDIYPGSDGEPMADNNLQFQWIMTIQGGCDALFLDDPRVFVAGDMLWYPLKGQPLVRVAPDIMVAFGRPKGYRTSYRQWQEDDIAPQVVFEILSPGNRPSEMERKLEFYSDFGVEEYYVYDPETYDFVAWIRREGRLRVAEPISDGCWFSPRLGVRFDAPGDREMVIYRPDGERFLTFVEQDSERRRLASRAQSAEQKQEEAERRNAALAARLRELGVDPDRV